MWPGANEGRLTHAEQGKKKQTKGGKKEN